MGDDIMALVASIPRTMRTLQWAVQAAIGYKQLLSGMEVADLNPDAYIHQLSRLHDHWARVRTHTHTRQLQTILKLCTQLVLGSVAV